MTEQTFAHRFLSSRRSVVGLTIVALLFLMVAAAIYVGPLDPLVQDRAFILSGPSADHWLGTDTLGRDLLARILHGARSTLAIALGAVSLMTVIGVALGAPAGYFGGFIDSLIMRLTDLFLAFPFILGAIAVISAVGPGALNVLLVLGLLGWPPIARFTRALVAQEAAKDYIAAARLVGASSPYIIRRHILPNILGSIGVYSALGVSGVILSEATLSFLGIGIERPYPAWGSMLAEAVGRVWTAPWLIVAPGAAIVLTCLGFYLLGEGLREGFALDERPVRR